jgi:hypothetical protein
MPQLKFWLWVIGLSLLYCLWLALMIRHPTVGEEQTLADRAPYWCDFHGMKFYRLGTGSVFESAKLHQCIDKQDEVHTYVEKSEATD